MATLTSPIAIMATCPDGMHITCADGSVWHLEVNGQYTQVSPPNPANAISVPTNQPLPVLAPGVIGA